MIILLLLLISFQGNNKNKKVSCNCLKIACHKISIWFPVRQKSYHYCNFRQHCVSVICRLCILPVVNMCTMTSSAFAQEVYQRWVYGLDPVIVVQYFKVLTSAILECILEEKHAVQFATTIHETFKEYLLI